MKLAHVLVVFSGLAVILSCGGGGANSPVSQAGSLSGNWQITLRRHVNPDPPLVFTGFLLQAGNSVTGSLILGSKCPGVGPIAGTLDGSNVSFTINEFGQDVSLTGTMPSGSDQIGGQFSNLAGGCTAFANTGTWSAMSIAPISGTFHGAFVSSRGYGTLEVTGTLTQGANTGGSTVTLDGTIVATGSQRFCNFLPPVIVDPVTNVQTTSSITGVISGTTASLSLYRPDGSQIAQIGQIGQLGELGAAGTPMLLASPDGTTLSGPYTFPALSNDCPEDQGQVTLTLH